MNKPELSVDGVLSYQREFDEVDKLFSAFAYLLKQFNHAFVELYEVDDNNQVHEQPLVDDGMVDMFYQMIERFNEETNDQHELIEKDVEFFLEHDIKWFPLPAQEELEDGMADFLETFFNAEWSEPDVNFLFLVGKHGFAIRIESAGDFLAWYEDAEFLDGNDLPFIETNQVNTVRPPEQPEPPLNPNRRRTRRTKQFEPQKSAFDLTEEEQSLHQRLTNGLSKVEPEEEPVEGFKTDDEGIHDVVKSFIAEVVMTGHLVHALTPDEWQDVYDILFGGVFLCVFGNEDKESDVPSIHDVAEYLYNHEGKSQILASLYLMSQNIYALQNNQRVEKIHEVTALLRYFDWLKYDSQSKGIYRVNDTVLSMTTIILSGKV